MVLATAAFVALPLPSGCDVPTGALNSTGVMSKRNELLLRSRATISLGEQLRELEDDMRIIDRELQSEAAPVLDACLSAGLFKRGGYMHHASQHPAWKAGLKAAAHVLVAKRGVLMVEAAAAFLAKKQQVLLRLRGRFGADVYVPPFFLSNNFVDESEHEAPSWIRPRPGPDRGCSRYLLTYPRETRGPRATLFTYLPPPRLPALAY